MCVCRWCDDHGHAQARFHRSHETVHAVVFPGDTGPLPVVAQLNRQIAAILRAPDVRERLAVQGLEAVSNSPAEFGAYIATEVAKWAKVIRQAGVVAD